MKTRTSLLITCHPPVIRGFTLFELLVVLFIISLSMAIVMPSVWKSNKERVKDETRHLSTTLRYVYDRALNSKETCVFRFNLDEDSYAFTMKGESRSYRVGIENGLRDIVIPSMGRVSEGEVIIEFGPLGPEEPIIVHLGDGDIEYTVFFNNLTGRTSIYEGYRL
jgi:prepilin-type N-terminal cleavage/methylation domain-containing protein